MTNLATDLSDGVRLCQLMVWVYKVDPTLRVVDALAVLSGDYVANIAG